MGVYEAPTINDLGSIKDFTEAFGGTSVADTAFDAQGNVIPNPTGFETGSQDGIFAPKPK